MTPEQLKELRKAAEEAKLGPWKIGAMESGMVAIDSFHDLQVTGFIDTEDAEFLLAANPATILQLLNYVESLERDAARWRTMSSLMFLGEVELTQNDEGGYSISIDPVETIIGKTWDGDSPEEAIDAAMGESK